MTSEQSCPRPELPPPPVADDFFRHACAHAGLAFISVDRSLRIQAWNAAAAHMFGASAASVLGMNISGAIPVEARARGEALLRAAVWRAETHSLEFKHRDEWGQPRTLIATFSPVIDDDGTHRGAFTVVRDITRRISLETELAQRHKMAALGEMAGALSHHFNNILGGIVTSVDFAVAADSPDLHKRTLRQAGVALGRAIKVVDSLLKFAEGDVRHADECDLTECILAVVEYMEPELRSASIRLDLELAPLSVTPVPRAPFVTVLENILHNCVDAMPDTGTVTITTKADHSGPSLTITDTGCGMSDSVRARVFEPFFSTKKDDAMDIERHPGLGLAVAHGIIQMLGHQIDITSQPEKGTCVTIRFRDSAAAKQAQIQSSI